jgi:hypothetical protein
MRQSGAKSMGHGAKEDRKKEKENRKTEYRGGKRDTTTFYSISNHSTIQPFNPSILQSISSSLS